MRSATYSLLRPEFDLISDLLGWRRRLSSVFCLPRRLVEPELVRRLKLDVGESSGPLRGDPRFEKVVSSFAAETIVGASCLSDILWQKFDDHCHRGQ
jgi:hypothetical protein